jgi:hypothetical protein
VVGRRVDGERQDNTASVPGRRHHRADLLSVAQRVRRAEARAGQIKELEKENARLKRLVAERLVAERLVAELSREKQTLQEVARGKIVSPERRRRSACNVCTAAGYSMSNWQGQNSSNQHCP